MFASDLGGFHGSAPHKTGALCISGNLICVIDVADLL